MRYITDIEMYECTFLRCMTVENECIQVFFMYLNPNISLLLHIQHFQEEEEADYSVS